MTQLSRFARITMIEGHGIGPEISKSVQNILNAVGARVEFDKQAFDLSSKTGHTDLVNSIRQNKLVLKGPHETPIGKGYRSFNLFLRKECDTYANLRPAKSIKGIETPFKDIDLVVVRENTEGEYSGLESCEGGTAHSIKVITESASTRIAEFAFRYAVDNKRKMVTAVHKANIMKLTDGLFLNSCRKVAQRYPQIDFNEMIVDACCMNLVKNPHQFDVMVMPNLYGDIVSDLTSGLIGGLGVTGSLNIGDDIVIAEAVHGTAPMIAGKDLANPSALLMSTIMMLRHIGHYETADVIEKALFKVIQERRFVTCDLGGSAKTSEFTNAIIKSLH